MNLPQADRRKIARSLESEEPLTRFLFDDAAEERVSINIYSFSLHSKL